MKSILMVIAIVAGLALSGCESVRNDIGAGVREKFTGPTYQKRVVAGDRASVFATVVDATKAQGFRITRSGAAQGVVEGVSGLVSDDRLSGSRQTTIKVRLADALDGGVEVAVLFTEVIEDEAGKGFGQATENSLRNHPLYESFWARVAPAATR